jgi:D-arabinose 5-phosphate isomerase GutQ
MVILKIKFLKRISKLIATTKNFKSKLGSAIKITVNLSTPPEKSLGEQLASKIVTEKCLVLMHWSRK